MGIELVYAQIYKPLNEIARPQGSRGVTSEASALGGGQIGPAQVEPQADDPIATLSCNRPSRLDIIQIGLKTLSLEVIP